MAGKTRTTIPVDCRICGHKSKDSAAFSSHLRLKHNIKSNKEKIDYLLKYDKENNYYCETGDGKIKHFNRAVLASIPFEKKCRKLSSDKYDYVKKLDPKYDKWFLMTDYLILDKGMNLNDITTEIINTHKGRFSQTSIEWFLKKTNGNLEEAKELQKKRQSTTTLSPLERLVNKYGEDEGLFRFNERNKKCSLSKSGFILRHGLDKGLLKYNEYQINKNRGPSKVSMTLFDRLVESNEKILEKQFVYYGINEYEIELSDDEIDIAKVKHYYCDFKYKNKVIEFNGDYWHKNPEIFEKTEENMKVWEYDLTRLNILKSRGYDILTIWENEFNNNPFETLDRCIEFLISE